jgi:hypothetical protein
MPSTEWSAKRKRQYQHIKDSVLARGQSEPLAEEIAARTVNKERAQHGESDKAMRHRSTTCQPDDVAASGRTKVQVAALWRSFATRRSRALSDEQGAVGSSS